MSQRRSLLEINQHDILRQRGQQNGLKSRKGRRSATVPSSGSQKTKKQRTLTEFNIPTTALLAVKRRKLQETSTLSEYIPIEVLDSDDDGNESSSSVEILEDKDAFKETVAEPRATEQSKPGTQASQNTQVTQMSMYSQSSIATEIEIIDESNHMMKVTEEEGVLTESSKVSTHQELDNSKILNVVDPLVCPMCDKDMENMSLIDRETHCDKCIEKISEEKQNTRTIPLANKTDLSQKAKLSTSNTKPKIQRVFTTNEKTTTITTALSAPIQTKKKKREYIPQSFKILTFKSGFKLIVDGFTYKLEPNSKIKDFFLSHFHADHYVGLKKSWNLGNLYSSTITNNLLKFRYTPKRKCQNEELDITSCFKELPSNERYWINETISVLTLEANHCPGASLFLFEEWNPDKSQIVKSILHTGDFRSNSAVINKINSVINGRTIDEIYLDTTYLLSTFTFPDQDILLNMIASFVSQINIPNFRHSFFEDKQKSILPFMNISRSTNKTSEISILYLVGTYSIGKEKLAIKIAEALNTKIYVQSNSIKRKMVELYWPLSFNQNILTDDPSKSHVHLVSLKVLSDANSIDNYMKNLQEQNKTIDFKEIFGFIPTGWTFGNRYQKGFQYNGNLSYEENQKNRIAYCVNLLKTHKDVKYNSSLDWLKSQYKPRNKYQVFKVPYSEHSSFFELLNFCINIPWHNMISTVNVDNGVNSAETSEWFKTFKYILENKQTLFN